MSASAPMIARCRRPTIAPPVFTPGVSRGQQYTA